MTRQEIRRRALRAAGAVAFALAPLGCGRALSLTSVDAYAPPPVADMATAGADLSKLVEAAPDLANADAGSCFGLVGQARIDCCDAIQWEFSKGCEAWGPPAPPAWRAVA